MHLLVVDALEPCSLSSANNTAVCALCGCWWSHVINQERAEKPRMDTNPAICLDRFVDSGSGKLLLWNLSMDGILFHQIDTRWCETCRNYIGTESMGCVKLLGIDDGLIEPHNMTTMMIWSGSILCQYVVQECVALLCLVTMDIVLAEVQFVFSGIRTPMVDGWWSKQSNNNNNSNGQTYATTIRSNRSPEQAH